MFTGQQHFHACSVRHMHGKFDDVVLDYSGDTHVDRVLQIVDAVNVPL